MILQTQQKKWKSMKSEVNVTVKESFEKKNSVLKQKEMSVKEIDPSVFDKHS